MGEEKIGLQLYSVRADCAKDLPGTLSKIAEMGYTGVEFAGFYNYGAGELRKMLDERDLECCGSHTRAGDLAGDKLESTIEFNLALKNEFLIVPGLPAEMTGSLEGWMKAAGMFNDLAGKLKPRGLRTGYHNHYVEFAAIDGKVPWEVVMDNTDPGVVMQIDTGNALKGGGDPVKYLEKYPGRAVTVHLKEHSSTNDRALIGEGDVNWKIILEMCRLKGGTRWYIVEQESYAYPPLVCAGRCLENLKGLF